MIDQSTYFRLAEISRQRHNSSSEEVKAEQIDIVRNLSEHKRIKAVNKRSGYVIEGKLKKIDRQNHLLTIEDPNGAEKVIIVLDYIVTIIPLLDIIIGWFKRTFRFKKRK